MLFISNRFLLMIMLTVCVGVAFSKKDAISDRLALCKKLCNTKKKESWFPWKHQKKQARKSVIDPVGFISSPFSQGDPADFDRTVGRRYSNGSGFPFQKS